MLVSHLAVGCSNHQCTEAGCFDGVQLEIQPAIVDRGEYVFELKADGSSLSCAANLSGDFMNTRDVDCHVLGSSQGIVGLTVPSRHPERVTLRVLRDGVEVGNASAAPQYSTERPNGEECLPTCRASTVQVDLSE